MQRGTPIYLDEIEGIWHPLKTESWHAQPSDASFSTMEHFTILS